MIIYCITNLINGNQYVGQTSQLLKKRWYKHCSDSKADRNKDMVICKAIKKYGKKNFKIEQIDQANNQRELDEKEVFWIAKLNTFKKGYNSTLGGNGRSGYKLSEETKQKISKAHKGKKLSKEHKKKLSKAKKNYIPWNKGLKSIHVVWNKGKKNIFSQETLQRMSEIKKGKKAWNKNIPQTEEQRINNALVHGAKLFQVFNRFTKELIGEWLIQNDCAKELNLNRRCIGRCLDGSRKYHKEYIFQYK